MKFPKQVIEELIDMGIGNTLEGVTFVEQGDWQVGHKGEDIEYIFLYDDKFYRVNDSREGSYFTDWNYFSEWMWTNGVDADEVEMVEVIIHKWVRVKNAQGNGISASPKS